MKKFLFGLTFVLIAACLMAVAVGAVTVYDDFDVSALENIEYRVEDVVVFSDGFTCPSVYVVKDKASIGDGQWGSPNGFKNAIDLTYINEKTGKGYTFDDVFELDVPEGVVSIGKYAGAGCKTLKRVSIPATVTTLGGCVFQGASGLQVCTFEHGEDSPLEALPAWMFYESGLIAFSMPDCIKIMTGEGQFTKCKDLTAVYLSKNLTKIEIVGRNPSATFDGANKLYFVNEPFVMSSLDSEIPEKPEVYYFPEPLSLISSGCIFRYCYALNDVLVFGENLTSVPSNWTFQNSPANTVVFLGDIVEVDATNWGTKTIIFANPADKSAADIATLKGSKTWIYCNAEGNTSHLAEPKRSTVVPATCVKNETVNEICYCGAVIGEKEAEGTALGHSHTVYVGIVYESFLEDGYVGNRCERCEDVSRGDKAEAIFTYYGFSFATYATNGGYSMTQCFGVNRESLAAYEESTGKVLDFGMIATVNKTDSAINPFENESRVEHSLKIDKHAFFEIKVMGFTEKTFDARVIFCLWATDGESTVFINDGAQADTVLGNSYAEISGR